MPQSRFHFFSIATLLFFSASFATAQDGSGTVLLSAEEADGTRLTDVTFEVTSVDGSETRTIVISGSSPVHVLTLPTGSYRVRAQSNGFRTAESAFDNAPGSYLQLTARLAPANGTTESQVVIEDRFAAAHQTVFNRQQLTALPSSRTVWSILETSHPFLISDRIDNGGLWSTEPALISGHGSSWSQTTFRLDGLDVTDPQTRGVPLFYPDVGVLEAVEVDSARLPVDMGGPGSVIVMVPRLPGNSWTGTAQAFVTPRSWQGSEAGAAASIARFESWTDGGVTAGGPLRKQLGLLASTRVTRSKRVERSADVLEGDLRSAYVHARARSAGGGEVRVITSLSDMTRPFAGRARFENRDLEERVKEVVLHSVWERAAGSTGWSVGGGYQRLTLDPRVSAAAAGGTIERLKDGPALILGDTARSLRQRWDLRVALTPALERWKDRSHLFRLGMTLGGSNASNMPVAEPAFKELLNGRPARVWDVSYAGPESRWKALSASAFVSDRISVTPGLTLDAGLRFDYDRGSADGAANPIGWTDLSPRFSARWRPLQDVRLAITTSYSWYRHRLPLGYFAVGDPAGPSGSMYRWDDFNGDWQYVSAELTRVAAVGACCAGNTIDAALRRPSTREFLIGFEHGFGSWRWGITGLDRREDDLVGLVNVGVTQSDYSVTFISDPGIDIAGLAGFNLLPVYNRSISSFGRDRFVLTNPDVKPSRYQGIEVILEKQLASRWDFRFGGTAHRGEGIGAYRGFRADENDQGLLGEVFLTPNALTSAYGRVFFDRGYAIKVSGGYQAPGQVRIGLAARYQDGQPFSRLVIADSLNQGPEAIQAYPRGGQRFTYTLTLDARVDKELSLGRQKLGLVFEAFNLLDNTKEVEEDIVTGPSFRTVTAVQPPRAIRIGARFGF